MPRQVNVHQLTAVGFPQPLFRFASSQRRLLLAFCTQPDKNDGVGTFSMIKWVLFGLSRFRSNSPSGYFFNDQMGTFWIDKNRTAWTPYGYKRAGTKKDARLAIDEEKAEVVRMIFDWYTKDGWGTLRIANDLWGN
jgi:hypothetical protein